MHSFYAYLEENRGPYDTVFHEMSHGESFLALLERRFYAPGFYCLDEPEAALSFSSSLSLITVLQRVVADGGQVLCATHSPVLAALPGATILEVGEWAFARTGGSTWSSRSIGVHSSTGRSGTFGTCWTDRVSREEGALGLIGALGVPTLFRGAECPPWQDCVQWARGIGCPKDTGRASKSGRRRGA